MRIAGCGDIPALRDIWAACFAEDKAYLDLFFSQGFPLGKTLIMEQDGQAASILTLLPCTCRVGSTQYPAAYVYGVATAPKYQGRGFSTALLAEADQYLHSQNIAMAFLVPASLELFGFYEKRGFMPQVYLERTIFLPGGSPGQQGELLPVGAEEYERLRQVFLPKDAILWDKHFLQYAAKEAAFHKGGLYRVAIAGETVGCCGLYLDKGQVLVKELLCPKQQRPMAVAGVQQLYPGRKVEVYLYEDGQRGAPYGCAKWYMKQENKPIYASLILD